jgi:murein DD-endopeptidase MepM/ murein hydrolase activator NlpD
MRTIAPLLSILMMAGMFGAYRYTRSATSQEAATAPIAYQATNDRERWAIDLAERLGNSQPSSDIVSLLVAWQTEENTAAAFNPLATSQDMPGATRFNSSNVKNYPDYQTGIEATAITLSYGYSGYAEILAGLQTNDPDRVLAGLSISPWAEEAGYGDRVRSLYQSAKSSNMIKADPIPNWQQHINVGFYAVNCTYWYMQSGCQHFGTDIGGNGEGTRVFAPYGGSYTGCVDNGDSGPYVGKWIEYTADDGAQFLINHFRDSPFCGVAVGTRINAGGFIGTMRGDANHVHVQVKVNGQLVDFEQYWSTH